MGLVLKANDFFIDLTDASPIGTDTKKMRALPEGSTSFDYKQRGRHLAERHAAALEFAIPGRQDQLAALNASEMSDLIAYTAGIHGGSDAEMVENRPNLELEMRRFHQERYPDEPYDPNIGIKLTDLPNFVRSLGGDPQMLTRDLALLKLDGYVTRGEYRALSMMEAKGSNLTAEQNKDLRTIDPGTLADDLMSLGIDVDKLAANDQLPTQLTDDSAATRQERARASLKARFTSDSFGTSLLETVTGEDHAKFSECKRISTG